ncbi:MAG: metal-dependent hydrolase [Phycisphaerales bacterium]|nr:metal-dependent hydrolase [Phycisphaerales bacterium]
MDLVTHAVFGAAAGLAVAARHSPRAAIIVGAVAGMLPDADTLIRFPGDSLSTWLAHRAFTHGIGFLLIGALIVSLPTFFLQSTKPHRIRLFLAALFAISLHAPLDAFTSFGTMLFWPFSTDRVSYDRVAIIDPLVTLPMLTLVIWSLVRAVKGAKARAALATDPQSTDARLIRRAAFTGRAQASLALVWAAVYILGIGSIQNARVQAVQDQLAKQRGHTIERRRVLFTPLQNIAVRSIYQHQGKVYSDFIRVPWFGSPTVWQGEQAAEIVTASHPSVTRFTPDIQQQILRFEHFTQGWMIQDPDNPAAFTDARYGLTPDSFRALWFIEVYPGTSDHPVQIRTSTDRALQRRSELLDAITGADPRFKPL